MPRGTLVVPTTHFTDLMELDDTTASQLVLATVLAAVPGAQLAHTGYGKPHDASRLITEVDSALSEHIQRAVAGFEHFANHPFGLANASICGLSKVHQLLDFDFFV
jgi:hypothetical protein